LGSERSHLEHLFQYQLVCSRHFRKSNSSTFKDLQTQIQGLSRTFRHRFKDFQGPSDTDSRTFKDLQTQIQGLSKTMSVFKDFPGLENLEKKFKDFQGPVRDL